MAVKRMPGCRCCCNGKICVQVTFCTKTVLDVPATVTITDPDGIVLPSMQTSGAVGRFASGSLVDGGGFPPLSQFDLIFTGGGGTGAAGYFQTTFDGHISQIILTDGGSGYTSAPTVSFANGAPGTATVGVVMVNQACVHINKSGTHSVVATVGCGNATATINAFCSKDFDFTNSPVLLAVPGPTLTGHVIPTPCGYWGSGNYVIYGISNSFVSPTGSYNSGTRTPSQCVPASGDYVVVFNNNDPCAEPLDPITVTVAGCAGDYDIPIDGKPIAPYPVTVTGCNSPVGPPPLGNLPFPGALVTTTNNTVPGLGEESGTTDASGVYNIVSMEIGCRYTITLAPNGACGYDPQVIDNNLLAACPTPPSWGRTGSLAGKPEYNCCSNLTVVAGPDDYLPLLKIGTLSGPGGAVTMSSGSTGGSGFLCRWRGCITYGPVEYFFASPFKIPDADNTGCISPYTSEMGSIGVSVGVQVSGNGYIALSLGTRCCDMFIPGYPEKVSVLANSACGDDPPSGLGGGDGASYAPDNNTAAGYNCSCGGVGTISRCPAIGTVNVSGCKAPGLDGTWVFTA